MRPPGGRPLALVDLAGRHAAVREELEAGVREVLRSGRFIGGPVVERCEQEVAGLLGRRFGVGAGSGTDALWLALAAAGIGPGDEVIVPALSFFATVESVLLCGATPVIVDVRADRPLLCPDALERATGPRVRAVVPVHLFGDIAEVDEAGLRERGVVVVADGAQVVGAMPPPAQGLVLATSFYPTKVLGAVGDGGLVATDDPELAARARRLGSHGMVRDHVHERVSGHIGRNSRLDAVQAAALRAQLPALPARLERRRAIAERLAQVLGGRALPRDPGSPVSVFVLRHPRRDELAQALRERGVHSAVYYPAPMGAQAAARPGCRVEPAPQAERFCREALAIPCHEGLQDEEVEYLCATLAELCG